MRSAADLRLIADDEVERGKALIAELGLREVTGRRRYRAWGIL
ncbi:helix-turn-helix domain-containing protein [Rhodoblastus acidophilus]